MSHPSPTVTIGIPAFNEEKHIVSVLDALGKGTYSNIVEILVADGGSSDQTRTLIAEYQQKDPRVKLVENPERIQSFGLNHMIAIASGDIFLRADAHAHYANDYVERSVETLVETGAKNVGGAQRFIAYNPVQAGVAMAVKSPLGSGGALYRSAGYSGFADTVFLGCFWLKDLREIGGFRTDNGVNEDAELNLRLQDLAKKPVYIDEKIEVYYEPRNTLPKLRKQYYRYGRSRYITVLRHPARVNLRGQLPFRFSVLIGTYLAADILLPVQLWALPAIGLILAGIFIHTTQFVFRNYGIFTEYIWKGDASKRPGRVGLSLITTGCILTMSLSHSTGYLVQSLNRYLRGHKHWVAN
jgi:glycosyltransferase involved in cell wall biosynthesis